MSPDNPDPERHADDADRPATPRPSGAAPAESESAVPPPAAPPSGYGSGEDAASTAYPGEGPVPTAYPGEGPVPTAYPGEGPVPTAYPGEAELTPDEPRRPLRTVTTVLGVVVALAVLGGPLGLLWAVLAPDTPVLKTAEGAIYADPQPEQPIAADGWFSLLGLAFGVLAALALWFLLRRRRGPVGLLGAVLGTLAAAPVAWQVGRRVGLATFDRLLDSAPAGQAFTKPADLRAGGIDWLLGVVPVPHGNLLLPAFGAAVTYTLLAGWSRWPGLRPEPDPAAFSWVSAGTPAPTAAPEPPAPGAAEPPRG
ncbi:DUF2567 domain-containing protein [Micromonospora sp. NPDC049274]|uniref:DUF2567 domain-containing protein n=1 Tax=Micromonospora sp. NPDC049274 TaxID=3154829 RepID=UPI003447C796